MDDLIEALNIFRKYGNPRSPTHCEHDIFRVGIPPQKVGDEDKKRLKALGFLENEGDECFYSYRFGSY